MATIIPFKAIRPNPLYTGSLVSAKPQAESVILDELPPLKDMLEAPARIRPETPERQAAGYNAIVTNLSLLLENEWLIQEQQSAIYIYETEQHNERQTGVWALTSLNDHTNGHIKTHELTLEDSARRIENYREQTGLEGSPILLAYPGNGNINRIIKHIKTDQKPATLSNNGSTHRLWRITDRRVQDQLIKAFAGITDVYLADGHHRLGSAGSLAARQQANNNISALYMEFDELRIREYHRVVVPGAHIERNDLLLQITNNFIVNPSSEAEALVPAAINMHIDGKWYSLQLKHPENKQDDLTDAAILQDFLLAPVFGITDPKNDPQLSCIGGDQAWDELSAFITGDPRAVVFILRPVTARQLKATADAGIMLPPKSTWIYPKVPYGLLLRQYEMLLKEVDR